MCKLIKGHYYFYVNHVDLSNVFWEQSICIIIYKTLSIFECFAVFLWNLCVLRERERKKNQSVIITSLCLESTPAASHCAVVYSVKDRNYSLHILFCSSSKKCFPVNYYLLFFCNYIQDVWICCEYTAIKWCYPINCLDFLGPCSAGAYGDQSVCHPRSLVQKISSLPLPLAQSS